METRIGDLEVAYTARGARRYRLELWHDGLRKHRVINGTDPSVIERKARLQVEDWSTKWLRAREQDAMRRLQKSKKEHQQAQKDSALERTREAHDSLAQIESILTHTLAVDDAIDWEALKDDSPFDVPKPAPPATPSPRPERPNHSAFKPEFGFLDKVMSSRKRRKTEEAARRYEGALSRWQLEVANIEEHDRALEGEHASAVRTWEERKEVLLRDQAQANDSIDRQRMAYEGKDADAILEYLDLVLSGSKYPDWMPAEWELDYQAESKTCVVEYVLPSVDALPTLESVTYVQSRDEFKEKLLPDAKVKKLYDSLVYQVALRTVHELFEADVVEVLDAVVFNGHVTSVDPRTGNEATGCILSLQAEKGEFLQINLAHVDPKACFKALKGVGSSKLHSLTPVAPIMQMRREDGRFVSAREIASTLGDSMNLAAMDWEDFEHLIRELFEREFKTAGGEVSVTQASRDGGVDAIAFDPDPIRGGKIVIQAKRYTNTVNVAAVRDLYGTVVNEGATKGILVTTSDYGPDAYSFAKDKPLTLLNGANLLHLLGKHGTRAKIDIPEARRLLGL
jgi:restriction system protein